MGHSQSKARSTTKGPNKNGQSATERLYPNLANEFPTYGPANTSDFRVPPPYEPCFGNPMPYFNGPSYCYNYNPAPSAPPELLCAQIPTAGQSLSKQEDGTQTKQAESSGKQNCSFNNGAQRNNDTERKPCPNAGIGCKLHFGSEEMKQHLKECLFSDVSCPLNGVFCKCSWRDKIKNITTHFQDNHPENIGHVTQEYALTSPRTIHLVELKPHKFLVHLKVDEEDKKTLVAVQAYTTEFCASKWSFEFEFTGPHMNETLKGTCFTTGVSVAKKFKMMQCRVLRMSICVMDGFKRGGLRYKYRIMKTENVGVARMLQGNRKTTKERTRDATKEEASTTKEATNKSTIKEETNKNTTKEESSRNRSKVWKNSKQVAAT